MRNPSQTLTETEAPARQKSWFPSVAGTPVVFDPARWTDRHAQIALWQAIDAWHRELRRH
jgi:hypothetical protein